MPAMMVNTEIGFATERMLLRQTIGTTILEIGTKEFAIPSIIPIVARRHASPKNHLGVTHFS